MGTDCKFVGNLSTLVQIQLGPIIHWSIMKWYNPFYVLHKCSIPRKIFTYSYIFTAITIYLHSNDLDLDQDVKSKEKSKAKRPFALKDWLSIDLEIMKRLWLLVIHAALAKEHIHIKSFWMKSYEYVYCTLYFSMLFLWDCSSIGESTALSRRKLRVRAPSVPTDLINTSIQLSLFYQRWDRGQNRISFPRGIFFSFFFRIKQIMENFHYFN